jgi:hypothetical protein
VTLLGWADVVCDDRHRTATSPAMAARGALVARLRQLSKVLRTYPIDRQGRFRVDSGCLVADPRVPNVGFHPLASRPREPVCVGCLASGTFTQLTS